MNTRLRDALATVALLAVVALSVYAVPREERMPLLIQPPPPLPCTDMGLVERGDWYEWELFIDQDGQAWSGEWQVPCAVFVRESELK